MDIQKAYLSLKQKVEENNTNGGIVLDKYRFVLLFNMCQLKYIDDVLDKKNEDEIRKIQHILVKDKPLSINGTDNGTNRFDKPDDYYEFSNVKVKAKRGDCYASDFVVWESKHEDVHELLGDEDNKPSFKHRETFYTIGQDQVIFYVDDFEITEALLTYYRYPVYIDIAGFIYLDGTDSKDVHPEFDDRVVQRILDICAKEFNQNEDNLQNYQYDRDRVYSNK